MYYVMCPVYTLIYQWECCFNPLPALGSINLIKLKPVSNTFSRAKRASLPSEARFAFCKN